MVADTYTQKNIIEIYNIKKKTEPFKLQTEALDPTTTYSTVSTDGKSQMGVQEKTEQDSSVMNVMRQLGKSKVYSSN